jgi:RND superfamily putative drug exporter
MIRFILRHKVLVVIMWVVLTTVGILTLPRIGPRLDYTYTTPGQPGFEANLKITGRFGIDPAFESMLPVLTLPAGLDMTSPEGRKLAADTFAAVRHAGPVLYQDYATTQDPLFLLDGGRSTWALVSIPNPDYGPGLHVEGHVEPGPFDLGTRFHSQP